MWCTKGVQQIILNLAFANQTRWTFKTFPNFFNVSRLPKAYLLPRLERSNSETLFTFCCNSSASKSAVALKHYRFFPVLPFFAVAQTTVTNQGEVFKSSKLSSSKEQITRQIKVHHFCVAETFWAYGLSKSIVFSFVILALSNVRRFWYT